jgi:hypothetical protein
VTPASSATVSSTAPIRGADRLLRIGVLGGTSLLLAAGAHSAGGGALPGPGLLVVVAAVLGLAALVVTQRRCRFPLLLVLLGGQQLALHAVFTAATNVSAACVPMAGGVPHHGSLAGAACLPVAGVAAGTPMLMSGPSMWLAHLAAVAATAWLLSRGEAWLWRTAERIIRTATAAPSSTLVGQAPVRAGFLTQAPYDSAAGSPAAPRGPPLVGTV